MTDAAPDQTFRLMYRSRDRIPAQGRQAELGALFTTARANNKKQNVTGALLASDDWFVQVLEGEESAVRSLYARIERDPRHDSVSLLEAGTVGTRVFGRWSMAKVAEGGEPDIPLIALSRGIGVAAGRGTTPDQDRVLDRMRDAARAESPVT